MIAGCQSNRSASYNNLANNLLEREQVDKALRTYQLAQVYDPDSAIPYFNAGVAMLEAEDFYLASQAFEQTLETAEDLSLIGDAYFGLGEAYFRQEQYRQAAFAYQQVLLVRPEDDDARYNMELALLMLPSPTPTFTPTPTTTTTDAVEEATTTPTPSQTPTSDIPEDGTPTITPTPDVTSTALGTPSQTPTPTGIAEQSSDESLTPENEASPTPPTDDVPDEPLPDVEDALSLLDDVQEGQLVIPFDSSDDSALGTIMEKDW